MAFLEKFGEKLTSAGKDVARKTKELADTAKLNMQISNEEDNIKRKYAEIGKLYYELFSSSPDEKFAEFCNSISESKNKIDELRVQILEIKGIKKCSNCGAEINFTATFCSSCGNATTTAQSENNDKEEPSTEVTEKVEEIENCGNSQDAEQGVGDTTSDVKEVVDSADMGETHDNTALLCPSCSNTIADDSDFCPECGSKLK
ncbi:MAG: zinc-ribbon domain-containing protein [Clostridiaceae bacterium]|jgi:uncharacterized OB-fold protein|nr:zinc-ribbon domain-containing protein [Clostridiaceae bacterium]